MNELLQRILNILRLAFGIEAHVREDDAWIDTRGPHSPREIRVARLALLYRRGALLCGALVAALLLVLLFIPDQTSGLAGLLLGGYGGAAATALLLVLVGLLTNLSALLLLEVGTLAQESWVLLLAGLTAIANGAALLLAGFLPGLLLLAGLGYSFSIIAQDWGMLHGNAVTIKELRGRMRGVRAFSIITIFLAMMGTFTVLLYLLQIPGFTGGRTIEPGQLGRTLFAGIVGIELVLIIFIVPALTAGAVTGERERKTYDLLQTTLLTAPAFLVGKMESALGYILLMLLSAFPLQSIAFLFGGVSETEVLLAFAILILTGLLLGALGLFFSAQTERTLTATVRVYTTALATALGLPLASLLFFQGAFGNSIQGVAPLLGATPLGETVAIYGDMLLASLNPISAAYYTQQMLVQHQQVLVLNVQLASSGASLPIIAPWLLLVVLYAGLTAVLILLALRRMRRLVD